MPSAGGKDRKTGNKTPRRQGKAAGTAAREHRRTARAEPPRRKAKSKATARRAATTKPVRSMQVGGRKVAAHPEPAAHSQLPPAAERIGPIIARLKERHPEARCSLDHVDPLQLLVATILSAQCTDARVNQVTKTLFLKYRSADDYATADPALFEEEIKSTGFFRNKTKSILGMAAALVERFGGRVPDTMDDLLTLPGVGRKTANVVLGNAFGKDEGVVVDTHVARIGALLGLTRESDPEKIEQDLMALVPRSEWTIFPHLLIHHGRATCVARRPQCGSCAVAALCPSAAP
jgi:endonuclease-3